MGEMSNNKRIFKNTIMLYVRMIVNMIISLYTARVVLQTLGVVDYGIYGVIGGVLGMFSFFNSSMSGATSRFLTYELGKGDSIKLKHTFSTALIIHVAIAIFVAILCETIGIWFINEKLVIPAERMEAALWVFQFSILSMIVSVTQVPYNASIFSHEKMDIYAYLEIANSLLKLLIVYLLVIGDLDKLILYAILQFGVTLLMAFLYRLYCIKTFEECHFKWVWDKALLKQMIGFSGWDLYGNVSVMARTQGVNMLMNMFFGPVMNAATDIATKVQAVTMQLSNNVALASRPQIVVNYSQDKHKDMITLMRDGSRITFILMMAISVPLAAEIDYILKLWLGTVPEYTGMLCILTLMWNLAVAINITTNYGVQATGKIRLVSISSGTLFLLVIPVTYVLFKLDMPYWVPFLYNFLAVFICPIIGGITLQQNLNGYSIKRMMIPDLLRGWLSVILVFVATYLIKIQMSESFARLVVVCIVSTIFVVLTSYFIIFPKDRRQVIKNLIISKIWEKKD